MATATRGRKSERPNASGRADIMQTPKVLLCGLKQDTLLTIPQTAERLGIAEKTAWNWIYLRRLPVVRLSRGCVRVSAAALERIIERATVPAVE
jgi:predicted DNA-binding transcriptional regulator AlpA